MAKRSVDQQIAGMASTARESSRGGSDIVDLRIYVRDEGSFGGEIIALDTNGRAVRNANGDEIGLPLSQHEHIGQVVQDIADRMRAARAGRRTTAVS